MKKGASKKSSEFSGRFGTNDDNNSTNNRYLLHRFQRSMQFLIPRIPGREDRFHRAHWIALAYRLPFFVGLCYLLTDLDFSPYVIQASLGPSMLPTIQFVGDIWLVETGAWRRAWTRLWKADPVVDVSSFQIGDLVLWTDPLTGRVSCKRLIGRAGDVVRRFGQFSYLYKARADFGIVWPSDAAKRGLGEKECLLDEIQKAGGREEALHSTLVVPNGYVWLEGDCPLFSVDSRHYGPIDASFISGRLTFRLWPWNREEIPGMETSNITSCWVDRTRPVPFSTIDPYLGKRFGFYKIPKK
jgi:signal peptidase I